MIIELSLKVQYRATGCDDNWKDSDWGSMVAATAREVLAVEQIGAKWFEYRLVAA